jgi:hypothetical protein
MKTVFGLSLTVMLAGCGPSIDVCYSPQLEIVRFDATGDQLFESLVKMKGGVNCSNGNTSDGDAVSYRLTSDFYLTDGEVEIKATDEFIDGSDVPKLQVKVPKNKVMIARNVELIDTESETTGAALPPTQSSGVTNTIIINNDDTK